MAGAFVSGLVLVGAVALGLGALLAASEFRFQVVKWLGIAYLAFLGVMLLRSRPRSPPIVAHPSDGSPGRPRFQLERLAKNMNTDS